MENVSIFPILLLALLDLGISSGYQSVNEYKCTRIGYFADPNDSTKYYECTTGGFPSGFISYTYTCPTGECYDPPTIWGCSKQACSSQPPPPEYEYTCLRQHLKQDAQLTCQNETLQTLRKQFPKTLEFTAFRGDVSKNLLLSLRDANWEMRKNYAKMIEDVGKNIFPLIVVTDAEPDYKGVGGVFKVYLRDGSMKRVIPVGPAFEINKSLSHMVLAVFAIISPYFMNPSSVSWRAPLRDFQQRSQDVLFLLNKHGISGDIGMTNEEIILARDILTRVNSYVDLVSNAALVDHEGFRKFANGLAPFIERCMRRAAEAHAEDTIRALKKLKSELGDEEWRKTYVIIPTVWPVSLYNIRLQALEKVMPFEQIKTQVLIVEGTTSEEQARTTLGRIVADRAVAELVWGGMDDKSMKDHLFSLQTRRDLLSSAAQEQLKSVCTPSKQNCPFTGRGGGTDGWNAPATLLRM